MQVWRGRRRGGRRAAIAVVGMTSVLLGGCGADREQSVTVSGAPTTTSEQTASTLDPAASCPPAGGAAVAASETTTTPPEQSPLQSLRDPLMSELWHAMDQQLDGISYEDLAALGAIEGVAPTDRASKGRQLPPGVAVYFSGPNEVTIAGPDDEVARIIREHPEELSRFTVKTAPPMGPGVALGANGLAAPNCPTG